MVVLLDHANGEFCLRQQFAEMLAGLGVTSVTVVRDEQTVGIATRCLEGRLGQGVNLLRSSLAITRTVRE